MLLILVLLKYTLNLTVVENFFLVSGYNRKLNWNYTPLYYKKNETFWRKEYLCTQIDASNIKSRAKIDLFQIFYKICMKLKAKKLT